MTLLPQMGVRIAVRQAMAYDQRVREARIWFTSITPEQRELMRKAGPGRTGIPLEVLNDRAFSA